MPEEVISGTLNDVSLDVVLSSLASSGQTGVLSIGEQTKVWLDGGLLVLIVRPGGSDLADVLFGGGSASRSEIAGLLDEGSDVGRELALRQPESSALTQRLLHEHNLNLLFELLVPSQAPFAFRAGETHPLGDHFAEPVPELITQATRRLELWTEIATRISSTDDVFAPAPELPGNAQERIITADEWRYLSLLNGRRSVADVITGTQSSAFRVCSTLYRLVLEGLIEHVPTGQN